MKNTILIICLLLSIYSHSQTIKGGYRFNQYGNIEYYKNINNSIPQYDTNHLKKFEEIRKTIANQEFNLGGAQIMNEATKSMNKAKQASERKDYKTAQLEAYKYYCYINKAESMISSSNTNNKFPANAYAFFLSHIKTDYDFIKMFDYEKIKYSDLDISFLTNRYLNLEGYKIFNEGATFAKNNKFDLAVPKFLETYEYQRDVLKGMINDNIRLERMADSYLYYLDSLIRAGNINEFLSKYNYNIIKYSSDYQFLDFIKQAYNTLKNN